LSISKARNPEHDIAKGIDKATFIQCQSFGGNARFLELIFHAIDTDKSGYIEWDEYLKAMSTVRCGNREDIIDLFFRLFDTNGNGILTFEEIREMCKINISNDLDGVDDTVEDIANYFTRTIFDLVNKPYHSEITCE
jgi:Ca2+-binding EF-hand superfamily protein